MTESPITKETEAVARRLRGSVGHSAACGAHALGLPRGGGGTGVAGQPRGPVVRLMSGPYCDVTSQVALGRRDSCEMGDVERSFLPLTPLSWEKRLGQRLCTGSFVRSQCCQGKAQLWCPHRGVSHELSLLVGMPGRQVSPGDQGRSPAPSRVSPQ